MLRLNCDAMAAFYTTVGFDPPWIGYVSMDGDVPVGGGAFKGPPRDARVEIAYYTLPEFERRGFATATARQLIGIAQRVQAGVIVAAQTLPTPNASNALLTRLGFTLKGTLHHPEDGDVWEWQLRRKPGPAAVPSGA